MHGHLQPPVEGGEHFHQAVQREAPEVCVADARKIRCGETREFRGFPHRKAAVVEHGDDPRRQNRLRLLQVRQRIAEVPKDIPAARDQFGFVVWSWR